MSKFRKKPVVIEAVQYRPGPGGNCDEISAFLGIETEDHDDELCDPDTGWIIFTLEGEMTASAGDWIIRGVSGEHYPCRDDIFRETYEAV